MKNDTPIKDLSPEKGFEWFFNEHYPALRYYAFKFTNDRDVAEDAAQRSFIALHEKEIINCHIRKPDNELKSICKSWLYTVTRNWCLNWMKFNKRRLEHEIQYYYEQGETDHPIEVEMMRADVASHMHKAINTLPTECKKIFYYLYVLGGEVGDYAQKKGLSISTVKNQKYRGLDLLQDVVNIKGEFIGKEKKEIQEEAHTEETKIETAAFVDRWNKILLMDGDKSEIKEAKWRLYLDMHELMPPREISQLLGVDSKYITYVIHCLKAGKLKFGAPKPVIEKEKKPIGRKYETDPAELLNMRKRFSVRQMADHLRVTENAIRQRIQRAKEKLNLKAA